MEDQGQPPFVKHLLQYFGLHFFISILLTGIIFLGVGIYIYNTKDSMDKSTEATITDVEQGGYDDNLERNTYYITLTYKDESGQEHTVRNETDESGQEHTVRNETDDSTVKQGDIIQINYDSSNPESISYGNLSMDLMAYTFMTLGAIMIIIDIVIAIIFKKVTITTVEIVEEQNGNNL